MATSAIHIIEEPASVLSTYGDVSIAFEVDGVFDVMTRSDGTLRLDYRKLTERYVKDYDIDGAPPKTWESRFDVSGWGFVTAQIDGAVVGHAAVAASSPDLKLLSDEDYHAVLWDIRVGPFHRRRGVGRELFLAAGIWARRQGYRYLVIETQNINVPACILYQRMGCVLAAMNPDAYPEFPNEVQLLWTSAL